MAVNSDKDMPRCLSTPTKQAKKARQLVEEHSHIEVKTKRARGPRIQGMFSRTMIVELKNGDEVVIQFRLEPLDLDSFNIPRTVLGPAVPEIRLLDDAEMSENSVWAYWMTSLKGQTWFSARLDDAPESLIRANKSLGRLLSKSRLSGNSDDVIEKTIRPHLELIATSDDQYISQFSNTAKDLLTELNSLKTLPLFVAHFDLNKTNIIVCDGEVTGLADWELSTPLPFGMGFHRIYDLAGEICQGEFLMPPGFEEAERGFWQEIYDGVDAEVKEILQSSPGKVQTAVNIGTLRWAFQLEKKGKLGPCDRRDVNYLGKLLSYRLPFCRADGDSPYSL